MMLASTCTCAASAVSEHGGKTSAHARVPNISSGQFVFDEGDQSVYFDFMYEFLNDLEENISDRRTK